MVKLNRIYTRTGDTGTSGLVDGSRRPKDDLRFEAIGSVDEANCALGSLALALTAALSGQGDAGSAVHRCQNDLFDLGADIATPGDDFTPSDMVLRITGEQVLWLEQAIDAANERLTPLSSFILPGGNEAAARAHIARAATRRAERCCVALDRKEKINPAALSYLNRLSDYLFVLARELNDNGRQDVLWVPGQNR
ncbi:MAG: cob(I)yrinic acid a,c-diamide adenosyltransferase [Sphingomonadaceae bacterium]